jgi:hypothetical protein
MLKVQKSTKSNQNLKKVSNNKLVCLAVETSCGETVYAFGEANSDGGLDWEEIDDMGQLGESAFCG